MFKVEEGRKKKRFQPPASLDKEGQRQDMNISCGGLSPQQRRPRLEA